jgi:hypothetical protein
MFQLTFAIITPALIIGAFAERMAFGAMLLLMALWSLVVYVPVTHWIWGGGWLQKMGALDFAGGIVVHVSAGVAGLVTFIYIGKRRGFPKTPMPPHSLTLSVVGAGMLWVGWFGRPLASRGARIRLLSSCTIPSRMCASSTPGAQRSERQAAMGDVVEQELPGSALTDLTLRAGAAACAMPRDSRLRALGSPRRRSNSRTRAARTDRRAALPPVGCRNGLRNP